MTIEHVVAPRGEERANIGELPETLGESAPLLVAADLAAAVIAFAAGMLLHDARSAGLAVVLVEAFAYSSARYRMTYAAEPRDEWYATLVPSAETVAALLIAVPLFQASWIAASVALLVWTALAGASASALTMHRRRGEPRRRGSCGRLDQRARARAYDPWRNAAIAAIDRTCAFLALVLLAPLLVACAVAIVAESGWPVIFRQSRVGMRNREFVIYKFRTMRAGAGTHWALEADERITRIGAFLRRTSLDEAPQLWNVLEGDMSLVGPRPEMSEYADRFARESGAYLERHLVRPGISGWAQLHYDRNFPPEEIMQVLAYDLFSIRHRSVTLHLYCMIKTFFDVLGHRAV